MLRLIAALVVTLVFPGISTAQTLRGATAQPETITGVVASAAAGSIVVETDAGEFMLFTIERATVRPGSVRPGTRVTVLSRTGELADDPPVAVRITIDPAAAAATPPAVGDRQTEPAARTAAIPPAVRQVERQIARSARRLNVGVRGGVALDPELVVLGAHVRLGPIFDERLSFRPNVEFAFGEVTALLAVNLEAVYRVPAARTGRLTPYFGGGPSITFIDQGFELVDEDRDIDFDDFTFDGGINLLAGVEYASGVFIEVKATAYTIPNIRVLLGFSF